MKKYFTLLLLTASLLGFTQSISFPDTVRIPSCSGSMNYDYSINCDGDKDHRAIFIWKTPQDSIIHQGTRNTGGNQLAVTDTLEFYLTVYGFEDTLVSNLCYFVPLCIHLNLAEYTGQAHDPYQLYDILGRHRKQSWPSLESGLYIVKAGNSAFKIYKQ